VQKRVSRTQQEQVVLRHVEQPQTQQATQQTPQRLVVLNAAPQPQSTGGTTQPQQPIKGNVSDRARAFEQFAKAYAAPSKKPQKTYTGQHHDINPRYQGPTFKSTESGFRPVDRARNPALQQEVR